MCGIVGIINKTKADSDSESIFTQLLIADQLRGTHGTGMFYKKGKKVGHHKVAGHAFNLIQHVNYKQTVSSADWIIGHNRFATMGSHSKANSHPFRVNNVTLVHNGTLTEHKNSLHDCEIDSLAIAHSINRIGFEETAKKINGAYALVWHDKRDGTLNVARNYQRPLHYLENAWFILIASEKAMLEWIVARNPLATGEVKSFDAYQHYVFNVDLNNFGKTVQVEKKPVVINMYGSVGFVANNYKKHYPVTTYYSNKDGLDFSIGDIIDFSPYEFSKDGRYIEGYTENKSDGWNTIRLYNTGSEKPLTDYTNASSVRGRVTSIMYTPNDPEPIYIVRTV